MDLSDCDELKEAADVLADLAANLGASDALDAAIAAKSIPKLKKAIAAAEGKADKKLIATATKLMTDLAEKAAAAEVAAAEYEAAVAARLVPISPKLPSTSFPPRLRDAMRCVCLSVVYQTRLLSNVRDTDIRIKVRTETMLYDVLIA